MTELAAGGRQVRIEKLVAGVERASRCDALPCQQQRRPIGAERQPQRRRRHRQRGRPAERLAERRRELGVGGGVRRHGVEHARHGGRADGVQHQAGHVVDMHPGEPLAAGAEPAAEPQEERDVHAVDGAAVTAERDACNNGGDV